MTSDSSNREDASPVAQPGTSPSKDMVRDRIALFEAMRDELRGPRRSRRLSVPKQPVELSEEPPAVRMRKTSVVEGPNIRDRPRSPLFSPVWPDEVIVAVAGSENPGARYGMIFLDVRKNEEEMEEEEEKEERKGMRLIYMSV